MGSAAGFRTHTNLAANTTSEGNIMPLNNYTEFEPTSPDQDL